MHKLNSAHVLRFYDWYETRNNLWLILEYCTGGDLEMLLKQDGYLPETSVRIFGLDILAGVKVGHFKPIFKFANNLKPSQLFHSICTLWASSTATSGRATSWWTSTAS